MPEPTRQSLCCSLRAHQMSREKKHMTRWDSNPGPLADHASTRTTELPSLKDDPWEDKGSQSENFRICLGPLVTSHLCHYDSPVLPAAACLLGRFRILGQSDCRPEEQAHFCDRPCLPPSPFYLFRFEHIFSKISDFLAGKIKDNNLIRAFCGCTLPLWVCILAAYRCFQIWNSGPMFMLSIQPRLFGALTDPKVFETPCGLTRHVVWFPTGSHDFGPYGSRKQPRMIMWRRHLFCCDLIVKRLSEITLLGRRGHLRFTDSIRVLATF